MYSKFTHRLQKVLNRAQNLANLELRQQIEPKDVLLSLAQEKGSVARQVLLQAGLRNPEKTMTLERWNREAQEQPNRFYNIQLLEKNLGLDSKVKAALERSVNWAAKLGNKYVGTEHLLYGLLKSKDKNFLSFLFDNQVNIEKLIDHLEVIFIAQKRFPASFDLELADLEKILNQLENYAGEEEEAEKAAGKTVKVKDAEPKKKRTQLKPKRIKDSWLEFFSQDLTNQKVQEKIDPVIGRELEIKRIIQILSRRNKNNPVLLGDAGVGKTAIVEGLAKKILAGDVPDVLLNKKIYALDMNLMVAGTMVRGEFELRLKQIINEAQERDDIILFIDEIHNIVGAGAMGGAMDAANILKPALARGEVKCIGATTYEDYKRYIEDDPALERRFQPVAIEEPSVSETVKILQGIKENYEKHHLVRITPQALLAAAHLSAKYIPERFLPDKAIDLIDEAAARFKGAKGISPLVRKIKFLQNKLEDLMQQKIQAVGQENYQQALTFKAGEARLTQQLGIAEDEAKQAASQPVWLGEITARDIAQVVSEMKKIPLDELRTSQGKKLAKLENALKKFVIGQDQALKEIAFFIKRSRAGLAPGTRPLGSFIFLGPSGVGKTHTAKVLAQQVFGSDKRLIRLDMSEFSESFNISRLIGSPPGYVGFREGGKLTEAVRRQPYSLVLFDEIEKAHPQVFNLLLQIMEEGQLTDAAGKKVDFKNTIIILTSNLGLRGQSEGELGFGGQDKNYQTQKFYENLKTQIADGLRQQFSPEFLNRLDKVIIFQPLGLSSVEKITALELEELRNNLKDKDIQVNFSEPLIKWLGRRSFSLQTGAREVRRVVQQEVENLLTEKILVGEVKKGGEIEMRVKNEKIIINSK